MFSWLFEEKAPIANREFKKRFEDDPKPAEEFSKKAAGREIAFPDNSVTTARYNLITFFPR
jgi:hypothetical protein